MGRHHYCPWQELAKWMSSCWTRKHWKWVNLNWYIQLQYNSYFGLLEPSKLNCRSGIFWWSCQSFNLNYLFHRRRKVIFPNRLMCVSRARSEHQRREGANFAISVTSLFAFFSFKESLKWIWSEIQIFDQFATFPLIFVYTSVIHLYCSHCAIQLFRSNCTIVSSGLFTGICCKKLSPTFLFRWPAKNWRQEHRLFDNGFLGIWRLGLPCSKMASKTYMQCNAHRKITFRWKKNSEIAQNVSNGLISSS